MGKLEKIKDILILKRASIMVIVSSFLYGAQLIIHPEILDQYRVYAIIRELFDAREIGLVFVLASLISAYGLFSNSAFAKKIARTLLMFLWSLFLVAFLITPPPNTVWIFAFTMVSLIGMNTLSNRG